MNVCFRLDSFVHLCVMHPKYSQKRLLNIFLNSNRVTNEEIVNINLLFGEFVYKRINIVNFLIFIK